MALQGFFTHTILTSRYIQMHLVCLPMADTRLPRFCPRRWRRQWHARCKWHSPAKTHDLKNNSFVSDITFESCSKSASRKTRALRTVVPKKAKFRASGGGQVTSARWLLVFKGLLHDLEAENQKGLLGPTKCSLRNCLDMAIFSFRNYIGVSSELSRPKDLPWVSIE